MNARIVALLAIMTAVTSLVSPVQAQSSGASNQSLEKYSITGEPLTGINDRNAQQDFVKFFEIQNSTSIPNVNQRNTTTSEQLRLRESLSAPNNSVFFVAPESFNGNDGAQVQFDFGNSQ
jgi:hypothetical protein